MDRKFGKAGKFGVFLIVMIALTAAVVAAGSQVAQVYDPLITTPSNGWSNGQATIEVKAFDYPVHEAGNILLVSLWDSNDDLVAEKSSCGSQNPCSLIVDISNKAEGTYQYYGMVEDPEGLDVSGSGSVQYTQMGFDYTPPVVSISYPSDGVWTNQDQTMTISATDNLSGVEHLRYCEGAGCTPGTSISNPYSRAFTDDYYNTIRAQAWDRATNPSDIVQVVVMVDQTDPVLSTYTRTPDPPNEDQDVTVGVTATDALSGVAAVKLYLNGAEHATVTSGTDDYSYTIDSGEYDAHETVQYYWTAEDNAGNIVTSPTQSFTVANQVPAVSAPAVVPSDPKTDDTVTCTGGTFSDLDDADTEQSREYRWYDGGVIVSGQTSSTLSMSVSGLDKGDSVTCEIRVSDGYDWSSWVSSSNAAVIQNSDPTAEANGDYTGDEGQTITFSGAGSSDPDGLGDIASYSWDFGDGSTGTGLAANHSYDDNGIYTVILTVTDADGATSDDTATATIANVAPSAEAGANQTVTEGDTVNFSGSFTDPGVADTHTFSWDFETDGTIDATTEDASHVYAQNGTYTATFTVTDDDGGVGSDTLTVTVVDTAPTAGFSWVPTNPDEGVQVSFTDSSTAYDGVVSWSWDFGDGVGTSTSQNPDYTYSQNGTYTVTLTVTDGDGSTDSDSQSITVWDTVPTVDFSWTPLNPDEGEQVEFTDLSSAYDGVVAWDWDFGGGTGTSTLQNPNHTYMANGSGYTVTLAVTDGDGSQVSTFKTIVVGDLGPTAEAGANQNIDEGQTVSVDGSASTSPVDAIVSYEWDWTSDGTYDDTGVTAVSPAYMANGTYTVTLRVTDSDGSTSTDTLTVTVNDLGPSANFTHSPEPQLEGSNVTFTDVSTTPVDAITGWSWDFGDGIGTSTEQNPVYAYQDNGAYAVGLTVTDADGSTSLYTGTVTITNVAPTVEAGTDQTVEEGETVQFNGSFTDPGIADTHTITWDFGDTNTATGSLTPTNIYTSQGTYTVNLTVEDDDGGIHSDTLTVNVTDDIPDVDFSWTPANPDEDQLVQFTDLTSAFDGIVSWSWDFGDGVGTSALQNPNYTYTGDSSYTVNLAVVDGDGSTANLSKSILVGFVNDAPVVNLSSLDMMAVAEDTVDSSVNMSLYVSDEEDAPEQMTWSCASGQEKVLVSVDDSTKMLTINATDNWYGLALVSCTAEDTGGLTGSDSFTVNVTPVNDAPVLNAIGDQTALRNREFRLTVSAADVENDTLTYSDDSPLFAIDPLTGEIAFTPTFGDEGNHTVTITVDDGNGGNHSETITLSVVAHDIAVTGIAHNATGPIAVNDTLEITANVTNMGDFEENVTVHFRFITESLENQTITLAPGETQQVSFTWIAEEEGYHTLSILADSVAGEDNLQNNIAYLDNLAVGTVGGVSGLTVDITDITSVQVGEEFQVTVDLNNTGSYNLTPVLVFMDIINSNMVGNDSLQGIGLLQPGETASFTFNVTVNKCAAYYMARAMVYSWNESGVQFEIVYANDTFTSGGPDLTITNMLSDIYEIQEGTAFTATVDIENIGQFDQTRDFSVTLYRGDPVNGVVMGSQTFSDDIAVGSTVSVAVQGTGSGTGAYRVYAVVEDPCYEDNNQYYIEVTGTSAPAPPPGPGAAFTGGGGFSGGGSGGCIEIWNCTAFSVCGEDGFERRICNDQNSCGTETAKPEIERACVYVPPEEPVNVTIPEEPEEPEEPEQPVAGPFDGITGFVTANAAPLAGIIAAVVLIGGAVYYFGFRRPGSGSEAVAKILSGFGAVRKSLRREKYYAL